MKIRYLFNFVGFVLGCILLMAVPAKSEALERTVNTPVSWPTDISSASVEGYNVQHYIYQSFPCSINGSRISYTLPDDGCTWRVTIRASLVWAFDGSSGYGEYFASETVTTSGSFTGYSLKTATDAANNANTAAGQARTAANNSSTAATNAATAANNASTAATNAATAANNSVTVATQARDAANSAKTSADNAATVAGTASANALNAYNEAVVINNKLDGLTTEVSALDTSEIVTAVKDPNGNTINAVRDTSGTVLDASRTARDASQEALTKIDTLQTMVNNYMSADTSPPVVSLSTVSGARATSGSSILAMVDVSDNLSNTFEYSLNGIDYLSLSVDGIITLPVNSSGTNTITVWVKDEAGNTSRKSITIRKF
ncbi:MAG: hypothetical protein JL50_21640 [Peptococcaceae bacterium BICA1-7]|nr:MAG: hypothetical protein JL50_21640 [Peptococcaceae bacterium BICA1-7]HBV99341.1 hypothetical protein [Desulfotomaculum sp.]